jgi:glycerol uptake facilitator protein
VYILPGLVGSGVAAVAYDFLAKPRLVVEPVIEAVTHPDPGAREPAPTA